MSQEKAKEELVSLLDKFCPHFDPFLEAQLILYDSQQPQSRHHQVTNNTIKSYSSNQTQVLTPQDEQIAQTSEYVHIHFYIFCERDEIKKALNDQTKEQFTKYAQEQYPGDVAKQKELISQLQERHFHQYMAYLCQIRIMTTEQKSHPKPIEPLNSLELHNHSPVKAASQSNHALTTAEKCSLPDDDCNGDVEQQGIPAPSVWTKLEHKDFIDNLKGDPESTVSIPSGEILKVCLIL
ncbi:Golgi resident protein GCP60 [Cichlidogyrus casuarinus]|uniref:Golgi resident protein GCP60 n=1 Tax=Cichlidogyrus casuarinus TaxID=1844966 RepID=A0ABD2QKE4_9PLAT